MMRLLDNILYADALCSGSVSVVRGKSPNRRWPKKLVSHPRSPLANKLARVSVGRAMLLARTESTEPILKWFDEERSATIGRGTPCRRVQQTQELRSSSGRSPKSSYAHVKQKCVRLDVNMSATEVFSQLNMHFRRDLSREPQAFCLALTRHVEERGILAGCSSISTALSCIQMTTDVFRADVLNLTAWNELREQKYAVGYGYKYLLEQRVRLLGVFLAYKRPMCSLPITPCTLQIGPRNGLHLQVEAKQSVLGQHRTSKRNRRARLQSMRERGESALRRVVFTMQDSTNDTHELIAGPPSGALGHLLAAIAHRT